MFLAYVVLAGLAGCLLKLVDDAYDNGLFDKRLAFGLNLINGVNAIVLMLNPEGFVIIGSIFWSSLLRGKVDNAAFRWGYLIVAVIWGGVFIAFRPFQITLGIILAFAIAIFSLFLVTKIHDQLKKYSNPLTIIFIERRHLFTLFMLVPLAVGSISLTGFVSVVVFVESYNVAGNISKKALQSRVHKIPVKKVTVGLVPQT